MFSVTIAYSFDPQTRTFLFNSFKEAKEYMEKDYTEELRIDKEENEWDSIGKIEFEDEYSGWATIKNDFEDNEPDIIYWFLGTVEEIP